MTDFQRPLTDAEIQQIIEDETIQSGPLAGWPIDWACDMHPDRAAVVYAEACERYHQKLEDDAIDAALSKRTGCLSESMEDRWPEGA